MTTENKGLKLKEIKPEIGFRFEANGKTYIVEDKLSIARAIEASKLELELFDLSVGSIKSGLVNAYNDLNGTNPEKTVKFADAAIKIHNLVNRFDKGFKLEENPMLKYAALFINAEFEDRRTIAPDVINTKIKDWLEEGIESAGFFLLTLSVLPSAKQEFAKLMGNISPKAGSEPRPNPESPST